MQLIKDTPSNFRRLTLAISGLDIRDWQAQKLQKRLESIAGVLSAFISIRTEMAYVIFDSHRTTPETIRNEIEKLGFEAGEVGLR